MSKLNGLWGVGALVTRAFQGFNQGSKAKHAAKVKDAADSLLKGRLDKMTKEGVDTSKMSAADLRKLELDSMAEGAKAVGSGGWFARVGRALRWPIGIGAGVFGVGALYNTFGKDTPAESFKESAPGIMDWVTKPLDSLTKTAQRGLTATEVSENWAKTLQAGFDPQNFMIKITGFLYALCNALGLKGPAESLKQSMLRQQHDIKNYQADIVAYNQERTAGQGPATAPTSDGPANDPGGIQSPVSGTALGIGAATGAAALGAAMLRKPAVATPAITAPGLVVGAMPTTGPSLMGKFGNAVLGTTPLGKLWRAAALAGGVTLAASAAGAEEVPTTGNEPAKGTPSAVATLATEGTAIGASIVGAAPVAAKTAALMGAKAVPVLGAVVAAGEGIYNTAGHALEGEWTKAGVSTVATVGNTIAGVGGIFTYSTLGTAWHESVRAAGSAIFGKDGEIEHSTVVQLGEAFGTASANAAPAIVQKIGFNFVQPSPVGMG